MYKHSKFYVQKQLTLTSHGRGGYQGFGLQKKSRKKSKKNSNLQCLSKLFINRNGAAPSTPFFNKN